MDLFARKICIKSSKVVDGVGGGYVYFFCMLLQILTHLSSFYCFEDAQLMSQIYYCTIFSSTKILDSGLEKIYFWMESQHQKSFYLLSLQSMW